MYLSRFCRKKHISIFKISVKITLDRPFKFSLLLQDVSQTQIVAQEKFVRMENVKVVLLICTGVGKYFVSEL